MTTLIDTEAAAVAVGVTSRTIRQWVAEGKLENHGEKRRVMVDLDALADFRNGMLRWR